MLTDEPGDVDNDGGEVGGDAALLMLRSASLPATREVGRCTAMLTPVPRMRP